MDLQELKIAIDWLEKEVYNNYKTPIAPKYEPRDQSDYYHKLSERLDYLKEVFKIKVLNTDV